MKPRKLKTWKDLQEVLKAVPKHRLDEPIIFGLVDDTLEDSWVITGIRTLNETDMDEETEHEFLKPNRLILYP